MKEFFSALFTKRVLQHFLICFASIFIIILSIMFYLDAYTDHNVTVPVPNFKNISVLKLDSFVKDKNVFYKIIDSVYAPNEKPGIVLKQDIESKTNVKKMHIIYLYVSNFLPSQIAMPLLVDKSKRQAISILENYGLKLSYIKEVYDNCEGCVVNQLYRGRPIKEGTLIKQNSRIELWIGSRNKNLAKDTIIEPIDTLTNVKN